ncbi:LysR family transcriptional regulator [Janibacter anophelis]|uniref:LysR family transcriptional regulator n=1 Tax=Janibacter anophelis TaxID=319054 RepID=UPI000DEF6724|nr:LysR family transcriptional regulator [Janibacter anophelis]
MLDVVALRALQQVHVRGTLARAAESLGFTPSAVSQQIKRLERQVGVTLIAPAGRGVVLTPAGRALVDSSSDVFATIEAARNAARSVAEGAAEGAVEIVAFSTAIRGLLAPVLQQLRRQHPRLELRICEEDPARALQLVDTGLTDIAIVHDADGAPLSMSRSLRHTQIHVDVGDVAVPAAHPLAASESLSTGDLRDQVWVTSPPGTVCHDWFRHLFAWTDIPEVLHSADDFSTQMALVAEGDVFALVPRLARPQPPPGVVVLPLSGPPSREVRAVWRSSSDASPGIRAVIAALAPAQPVAP